MFKNIYKLRQGHYAIFKNGDLNIRKYWDLEFKPEIFDEDEATERIFSTLEKSVKKRLISDVPLGVFLSGGLDSSTIVGFVSKLYPKKIQTFSIGYKENCEMAMIKPCLAPSLAPDSTKFETRCEKKCKFALRYEKRPFLGVMNSALLEAHAL